MAPVFALLAGPNGSGKSTISESPSFRALNFEIVNPDVIAREAPIGVNPLIWSGREVRRRIDMLIAGKRSFSVETTLSGNNHFQTIEACRNAGMLLTMHYVFVRNLTISKDRVEIRVANGGHDVPEADQERRFARSIENSLRAARLMDEWFFYDNSSLDGHQLVAAREIDKPAWISPAAPDWLKLAGIV